MFKPHYHHLPVFNSEGQKKKLILKSFYTFYPFLLLAANVSKCLWIPTCCRSPLKHNTDPLLCRLLLGIKHMLGVFGGEWWMAYHPLVQYACIDLFSYPGESSSAEVCLCVCQTEAHVPAETEASWEDTLPGAANSRIIRLYYTSGQHITRPPEASSLAGDERKAEWESQMMHFSFFNFKNMWFGLFLREAQPSLRSKLFPRKVHILEIMFW